MSFENRPSQAQGPLFPLRRERGDVAFGVWAELICGNVEFILGTRATDGTPANKGELRWEPTFGSLLYKLRHRNTQPLLQAQARAYVVEALARWEPRVRVRSVSVESIERRINVRTSFVIVDVGLGVGETQQEYTIETPILRSAE